MAVRPGASARDWIAVGDDEQTRLAAAIENAGGPTGAAAIMAFLNCLTPFTSCLVVDCRPSRSPRHLYDDIKPDRRDLVVGSYLKGAYLLDPFHERLMTDPGSCVLTLREVQPDHFRKTEFFKNYYAETRLADEICILMQVDERRYLFFSLGRARGSSTISKRERRRLELSLPVLAALTKKQWVQGENSNQLGLEEAANQSQDVKGRTLEQALHIEEFSQLTAREREIVALMLKGHSSKSISRLLEITVGTVKNHRKSIFRKLSITSQSALFARFLQLIS